ncbi:hypothetical protein GWK47_016526 [Chionoecetes opilio]|uniref:Uncharacterized protein n=1 Tax=Chionoecetes opilio TaxID=41210 RepID=A0A8J4XUG8_CHIOP|nr:hypothetical protein GWK47_016526 [Chionoecetes opilio]
MGRELIEAREEARHYTQEVCNAMGKALSRELAALRLPVVHQASVLSAALEGRQFVTPAPTEELPEHTSDLRDTRQRATQLTPTHRGLGGERRGGEVDVPLAATSAPYSLDPSLTPHSSPPRHTSMICGPPGRRKPSEFDGKVAWEAYLAQFEFLADAQDWGGTERAIQLVASLRGAALEVLAHLTPLQRTSYSSVVEALRRRFGHHQQAEVFRANLKVRVCGWGEPLPQLAQEVETLVRRAYPTAPEEILNVLAREHFVDALQDRDLQL